MRLGFNNRLSSNDRFWNHVEWVLLLALLPLVLIPLPLTYLSLLIIPLLWLVRKHRAGHFFLPTPSDWSILLLLVMVLISLFVTYDIRFSVSRVAAIVYGVAVYYAAATAASRSKKWLFGGVGLLLVAGLLVSALSLIGTRWTSKLPFFDRVTNSLPQLKIFPAAPEGYSPNQVAGVLLWVLPVFIALALCGLWLFIRSRHGRSLLHWLALSFFVGGTLFMLATLLLTQSRSGYLGLVTAILVVTLIPLAGRRPGLAAALASLAILAGVILFLFWPTALVGDVLEVTAESVTDFIDQLPTKPSLTGRLEIWSRAVRGLEDFPLTGMGVGTFRRVAPGLYPLLIIAPGTDIAHAHNLLLQVGLDLGLPGLIAYLALWLASFIMLWRIWRVCHSNWVRALIIGFSGALAGYFIYGLTETVALGAKPGFIFWLLLGLIAGMHQLITGSRLDMRM